MTKAHLLWWMIDFLFRHHPDVLARMVEALHEKHWNDRSPGIVGRALVERLHAYHQSKED